MAVPVRFCGSAAERSAPPTIPFPQTIHGLLMGQAAEDDRVHVDGGGDSRRSAYQAGSADKPPGEHYGTFNCERA